MNKNVLRADLNESIVFEFLISSEREFHRCGAAYENDLCPYRCGSSLLQAFVEVIYLQILDFVVECTS